MTPAVGRSRPTIIFATVVLPDPDSPTMASDPPSGSENETSSTATSWPNSLRRPLTSRIGSAMRAELHVPDQIRRAHAARHAAVELDELGARAPAHVLRVGAARRESALRLGRLERGQRAPGDREQTWRRAIDARPRGGQRRRVRVQGLVVQTVRLANLDD